MEDVKTTSNKDIEFEVKQAPDVQIVDENDQFAQNVRTTAEIASIVFQTALGIMMVMSIIMSVSILFRSMRGGGSSGIANFIGGKNYEKDAEEVGVTFNDVAGLDGAKIELQEIVDFLKNPAKYEKIGAKIPKGCLLTGGPGLGKTLLAKAVAGEAGVPFFSCSASEFIEMFVGVGASRVRDIFQKAKARAPCIIFIDEIDAIGKARGSGGMMGSNDEREQTINQLLTEMDGFDARSGIVVIGATNRADILDPALVRPGRFDRKIALELPGVKAREAILRVHAQGKPFKDDVCFEQVAKITGGFSGADLSNLLNESAICAARRNEEFIAKEDIDAAMDRILLGLERKDSVISEEKRRLVAYHEAGHTVVALKIGGYDTVKKVTIVPRGKAGGLTVFENNADVVESGLYTKSYLENQLAVALGGRAAEELVFGKYDITTGASSDMERVQQIARAMITQFGFSEKMGHVNWANSNQLSEKTLQDIDDEVKIMSEKSYKRALNILENNKKLLRLIAEQLLEKETINCEEIKSLDRQ